MRGQPTTCTQPGGHNGTEADHQEGRREEVAGAEAGREAETLSQGQQPGDDDAVESRNCMPGAGVEPARPEGPGILS